MRRHSSSHSDRARVPAGEVAHRLSLFVMVLVACSFLLLDRAEATVFDRARDAAGDAVSPVLEIFSGPVVAVRNFLANVQSYLAVHEENQRLREENARLLAWQAEAQRLQRTIDRYNALLNVQVDPALNFTTGRVVADDGGPFQRTLLVHAGRNSGVDRGQAAIDNYGFVGRVVGVGQDSARILLITDLNSRIPVYVEPGHHRAILAGDNSDLLRLEYLGDDAGLEPGSRVVTTGEGGLIPPGIPVGIVAGQSDGIWRVRSATRFDSIEFVRMLRFDMPRDVEMPGLSLPANAARIPPADDEAESEASAEDATADGEGGE